MKISLNCRTVSNEVQNIEISTEVIKGSLEIDFLQHEDGMCYHLLKKNGTLYEQVSITFDSQLKTDFLDVGQNTFILRAYLDGYLLWESNSFVVNNENFELLYHLDANSVQLYWNKVIGADGYMLYAKSQDDIFTSIKEVQTNEAVLYGLNGSEELKVKPFKKENGKRVYEFGFATCKLGQKSYLEKLRLFSAIKKSSLSLYWENVANADSYKIYRLTNGKYVLQDVVSECYFTENYLPVGFSYFKVEACIGEEVITSSQTIVCNIKEVEMFAVNVNYKVILYWNKAPGVAGYRIFKRTQDGNFTGFVSTTEAKYTVENVVPGEFCEFKVKPFIIENGKRLYGDLEAKCAVQTYKTPKIDLVVNLVTPKEELIDRMLTRRVCTNQDCKATYNIKLNPPKQEGICDKCNSRLNIRSDDNAESFITRFDTYINKTQDLINYYKDKDVLKVVKVEDGLSANDIFKEVEEIVNND